MIAVRQEAIDHLPILLYHLQVLLESIHPQLQIGLTRSQNFLVLFQRFCEGSEGGLYSLDGLLELLQSLCAGLEIGFAGLDRLLELLQGRHP